MNKQLSKEQLIDSRHSIINQTGSINQNDVIQSSGNLDEIKAITEQLKHQPGGFRRIATSERTKTFINTDEYFKKDQLEQFDLIFNSQTEQNYFVTFRYSLFLEFLLYFCIFYFLGPASYIILWIYPGRNIMYSLHFCGSKSIRHNINYFLNLLTMVVYFLFRSRVIYIYAEIVYFFIFILTRNIINSIKYATCDPLMIQYLKKSNLSDETLQSDVILNDWNQQSDELIYQQIDFVIQKYQYQQPMFYLEFIGDPGLEIQQILTSYTIDLSKIHEKTYPNSVFQPDLLQRRIVFYQQNFEIIVPRSQFIFYGFGVVKLFVQHFKIQFLQANQRIEIWTNVYALFRSLLPSILRYHDKNTFFGQTWDEVFVVIMLMISTFRIYRFVLLYLQSAIFDLKRKKFMLDQCSFLICPRKINSLDEKKILPTINIFCDLNIKAWEILRSVCYQYGQVYFIRNQVMFAFLITITFIGTIVVLLSVFQIISLQLIYLILVFLDVLYMGTLSMLLLKYSADINQCFTTHINLIFDNLNILNHLIRYSDSYFNSPFSTQQIIYKQAIQIFKKNFGDDLMVIKLYIKELISQYQELSELLAQEEKTNSFQIFGITVTWGFLKSLLFGLISLIFTICYKFFTQEIQV